MTAFSRNVAIVIRIDAYVGGIPPLRTAVADTRSKARRLEEKHGYTVTILTNDAVTRDTLRTALSMSLTADDRVLLYFAGQGVALDGDTGEGFLLLHDARDEAPEIFWDDRAAPRPREIQNSQRWKMSTSICSTSRNEPGERRRPALCEPAHDELARGWDRLLHWSREAQEEIYLRQLLHIVFTLHFVPRRW